jgi:hypothetical protein
MRESLVVKTHEGKFRRLHAAGDSRHIPVEKLPRYTPASKSFGSQGGVRGEYQWPEMVTAFSNGFRPKRGRVEEIRHVPEEYRDRLQEIDDERWRLEERLNDLHRREQQILESAYSGGEPLKVVDMKVWQEERRAARAAEGQKKS